MRSTVRCSSRWSRWSMAWRPSPPGSSTPAVGSSQRSTVGAPMSAKASSRRWNCPPESVPIGCAATSGPRLTSSIARWAAARPLRASVARAQEVEARDGQLALEVELLGHVADARPRGPADRPLVGDAADQRAEEDGLARAVGPDDGERAALGDGDREVVQDRGGAEADGEVLDLEDVRHAATPSRPEPTGRA